MAVHRSFAIRFTKKLTLTVNKGKKDEYKIVVDENTIANAETIYNINELYDLVVENGDVINDVKAEDFEDVYMLNFDSTPPSGTVFEIVGDQSTL